jgi:hypothetical protein
MIFSLLICIVPLQALAAFESGSDGSDGALVVSVVDSVTSVSVNGVDVGSELQIDEDGVFNFTTVNVQSGATLKFRKNSLNSPVTILASGDVTIDGTINVSGQAGNYIIPGEGGPGGFDGGVGGVVKDKGKRGEGPGGGVGGLPNLIQTSYGGNAEGGAFSASGVNGDTINSSVPGASGSVAYGNERIIPLIGGSGGGGGGGTTSRVGGAGGGGGGAILIASSESITVNGAILANGGRGADGEATAGGGGGGGGAGGAIRLITDVLNGNGTISAVGGAGGWQYSYYGYNGGAGSDGRIRIEYVTTNRTAATNPPMSFGYALSVEPPDMPTLTIASIAGVSTPTVPKGDFNAPDVVLPYGATNPVSVVVNAVNVPADSVVTLTSNPSVGNSTSASAVLVGNNAASSANVDLSISMAYPCVITASVTYELSASVGGPFFIDGELIAKVRVESSLGGTSQITYITENGREIPAIM